jgi:hypothetical protein
MPLRRCAVRYWQWRLTGDDWSNSSLSSILDAAELRALRTLVCLQNRYITDSPWTKTVVRFLGTESAKLWSSPQWSRRQETVLMGPSRSPVVFVLISLFPTAPCGSNSIMGPYASNVTQEFRLGTFLGRKNGEPWVIAFAIVLYQKGETINSVRLFRRGCNWKL